MSEAETGGRRSDALEKLAYSYRLLPEAAEKTSSGCYLAPTTKLSLPLEMTPGASAAHDP